MSGGFKFYHRPPPYVPANTVARKCIVCGTTKHECNMKPFMLKGDDLNLWANAYFSTKRTKVFNFYAKLRYTINPYSCAEHFRTFADSRLKFKADRKPRVPTHAALAGKRNVSDLLEEGEEPPSIARITEKKPSPPPETPKTARSEKEVTDAIMGILKNAKVALDQEAEAVKSLNKKVTQSVNEGAVDEHGKPVFRKQAKKGRPAKEAAQEGDNVADDVGSDDDADDATSMIDVEAIDSDGSESTYSEVSSIGPASPSVAPVSLQRLHQLPPLPPQPIPLIRPVPSRHVPVLIPRFRPYTIAAPPVRLTPALGPPPQAYRADTRPTPQLLQRHVGALPARMMLNVPRRLTLTNGTRHVAGPVNDRSTWFTPNPGPRTLASVLQKFWNDDITGRTESGPATYSFLNGPDGQPKSSAPMPFGQGLLPGTKTKFKPAASLAPPALMDETISQTPSPSRHPPIRYGALLHNPPLSPSRLIIGSEETVTTTIEDEEPEVRTRYSSSSSNGEDDSEVEVCDNSSAREPIVEGPKIEGELEETSVKSWSAFTSSSSESSSSSLDSSSSSDEEEEIGNHKDDVDIEVDVETVDEASGDEKGDNDEKSKKKKSRKDKKHRDTVVTASPPLLTPIHSAPAVEGHRRKHVYSAPNYKSAHSKYWRAVAQNKRLIHPPSAVSKPPTRLLSAGHYSMRDLLHAQARASTSQPVKIDTTGLLGVATRRPPRPRDMPRLFSQGSYSPSTGKRQSEWARLEAVVERKLAEHKAKLNEERKQKQKSLVDPVLMSENPPPELTLEEVDEANCEKPVLAKRGEMEDGFPTSLVDTLTEGVESRTKVLRMRFHKKDERVLRKLKVLDPSTCPKGVGMEVEVKDSAEAPMEGFKGKIEKMKEMVSLAKKEKKEERRRKKWMDKEERRKARLVTHPSLVIVKTHLIEMQEAMNSPPPVPIVGIPDKKQFAARREMYEKERHEMLLRGGLLYGKFEQETRDSWQKEKLSNERIMARHGVTKERMKIRRKGEGREGGGEDSEEEEDALIAEAMKIVKRVKDEKKTMIMKIEGEEEMEKKDEKKETEVVVKKKKNEESMMIISDIEDEEVNEGEEKEKRMEKDEDKQGIMAEDDDEGDDDGSPPTRKSHRLKEKRLSQPPNKSRFYWKMSDDEETRKLERKAKTVEQPQQTSSVPGEKRNRGRPRKFPQAPPPKRKREENTVMTDKEKKVLARVLPSSKRDNDEEIGKEKTAEEEMEKDEPMNEDAPQPPDVLRRDDEAMKMDGEEGGDPRDGKEKEKTAMVQLEKPDPKATTECQSTSPYPCSLLRSERRFKLPWVWKQRLGNANNEMGGRLCNYCMMHLKRNVWLPNEATALMDHARIHSVETLMCPHSDCTYMNSQRSRVSQHVSYVHKKWGMPIDLAEMYPSMRKSLMMRLRHCFPDMPTVSVCQQCRVAVRPEPQYLRWHAQTHLDAQCFECSRDICTLKFSSEQECLDHIEKTKCHGSVLNGLSDKMEMEVSQLVKQCFRRRPLFNPMSSKIPKRMISGLALAPEHGSGRPDYMKAPLISTARPLKKDNREKETKDKEEMENENKDKEETEKEAKDKDEEKENKDKEEQASPNRDWPSALSNIFGISSTISHSQSAI